MKKQSKRNIEVNGSGNGRARSREGWGRTVGAFALGAAAGSAVALLTAPASGKVTRKRIGRQMRILGNATERQLKQAKKLLSRQAVQLRGAAVEKIGHTREWLQERIAANGNNVKHLRKAAAHS
ncbi:MAG: YtxH domain-containing protein [Candidatus Omnitrophica bacterium]|nr:YtxH domain-containing protein [Candidatus Omnitrophota bacterium]